MAPTLAIVLTVLAPLALAAALLALPPPWARRLCMLGPLATSAVGLFMWTRLGSGPRRALLLEVAPQLKVNVSVLFDRHAVFFLVLVGLVGLAVFQYARAYFGDKASRGFWALMLAFMAAMSGLVVSDNLVLLYLFWELTTVTSSLLIAGDGSSSDARRGAVQAFLVTEVGGLCLLAGIVLLGQVAGTLEISQLVERGEDLSDDPRIAAPLALMLVGALAKSAQFPFHFWLPGAMAAPTPVSAYLHSATMVQAGLVLVARLLPALGRSPLWMPLLATVGLTTFVVAGWSALRSWDLKRVLAHSTAAYLGLVTAYYGYIGASGLHDDLMLVANHALYKSALFLLVGWIEKVTGTRDLRTLTPERWVQHVPVGAALFAVGVLAMAGAPLLLGFVSKETFLQALLEEERGPTRWIAAAAATLGSGLALGYALKFGNVFFGREPPPLDRGHPRHEVSRWLVVVPALLLVPQLLFGAAPRPLAQALEPGTYVPEGPAVWHGADLLMGLSLAGYLLGAVFFLAWQPIARAGRLSSLEDLAAALAKRSLAAASWASRAVQAGGSSRHLALVGLAAASAAVGLALAVAGAGRPALFPGGDRPLAWIPSLLIFAGAGGALLLRDRASKAVTLGMAGFGVAVFYALFRAPDLVLTQVLVESLSLVLLLLAFRKLPPLEPEPGPAAAKVRRAVVGVTLGGLAAALVLGASGAPAAEPAGRLQLARSLPEGHGHNAVNVILVDFRGADTLGEITVLVIAALGALVLLGRSGGAEAGTGKPRSRILEKVATGLLPAELVFALYLLARGHDAPGGGFIAGLVVSLAFVLSAIALGAVVVRRRLHQPARGALAAGLLVAACAPGLALLWGRPFFTHLRLPGSPVLSTTFLFDLGVFAVVVATASVFVSALARGEP